MSFGTWSGSSFGVGGPLLARMGMRRSPWAMLAVAYGLTYVVLAATRAHVLSALGPSVAPVTSLPLDSLAFAMFARASRRTDIDPDLAIALRLIACASAVVALCQCLTLAVTFVAGADTAWSWTPAAFLVFYPIMLVALLRYPHARRARLEWWKFALDAATIIVGGVVVVWYFVIRPATLAQHNALTITLELAFPTGDLLLLFGLTTLLLRLRPEHRSQAFMFFLIGQCTGISADLYGAVFLPATDTAASIWPQFIYILGGIMTAASGELYGTAAGEAPDRVVEHTTSMSALSRYQLGSPLPYAAAGAVYLLALIAAVHDWRSPLGGLVIAAAPVTLLLTARGMVAVRQNARLLTEQAERAGQARLVALLDATTDLVAVADAQGETTYINSAGRDMIGIGDGEDVRQVELRALYEPASVDAALRDGVWEGESTVRTRDGRDIPVSQVVVAHQTILGDRSVSTIMRDISGWKRLDRMKSEFVSTVSHELRTPLTAIRGSLGLLEGGTAGTLPALALELTHVARRNCDRLVRLLNDMLDLDKIEAGKLDLRPTMLGPGEVIHATIEEVGALAAERNIRLTHDIATAATVMGDRDRIVRVLTNLVSNAIKFSPDGATVMISVRPGDMRTIRFAVIDRGIGIASHDLPRLFGRFQQLDSSDRRQHGGTGLGLAIAKAIVEQHGGTIGVSSEPHVLTTFWFELPQ